MLFEHVCVCNPLVLENTLDKLHTLENLLFLKTFSDDLHADRQTVHAVSVITRVSILLNLVPWPERTRKLVERAVHARNGHNSRGIIELRGHGKIR